MSRQKLALLVLTCSLLPCLACSEPPQTCDTDCSAAETGSGETTASQTGTDTGETGPSETETGETETGETETGETGLPDACTSDTPIIVMDTSMGTMVVQLDAVRAPITVENFVNYVGMGFYDGTIFHRVIDGFVIQGGGYEPGLVLKETLGTIPLEIHPELRHVDGAIGMARSQAPDTAESQWYFTDGAQPALDDQYAVFGVLIDGWDVRNAISAVPTETQQWMGFDMQNVPITDVVLEEAYCVETWP
jgi:cyclophilin family peptidyl-prolyl cis-trans isomerase